MMIKAMKKNIMIRLILVLFVLVSACSPNKQTLGIDVSHHNSLTTKDWESLKQENISFVYFKASEGKSYRDSKRYKHHDNAWKHKLYVGAYHFFRDDCSAESQYVNFDRACEGMILNLLPCIDYERAGFTKSYSKRIKILKELNELFVKRAGVYPIIYCDVIEYAKLKPQFPNNLFWISASSPNLHIGIMKQELKRIN